MTPASYHKESCIPIQTNSIAFMQADFGGVQILAHLTCLLIHGSTNSLRLVYFEICCKCKIVKDIQQRTDCSTHQAPSQAQQLPLAFLCHFPVTQPTLHPALRITNSNHLTADACGELTRVPAEETVRGKCIYKNAQVSIGCLLRCLQFCF